MIVLNGSTLIMFALLLAGFFVAGYIKGRKDKKTK